MSSRIASSVALRTQLLSTSSPSHLVTKHSADSTTPHYLFPPFLVAVGHGTVSTPNTIGTLSVEPSVAVNTMRSSTRHWAKFFSGRPGPGFSPPTNVPNIIRKVSHSLCVRCAAPANMRRGLLMAVSTLSHCAFLRALAYDMRWSVRSWRWKPMIRRRNLWCAVRRSAKCSLLRVHVTNPYCRIHHIGP